MAKKKTKQTQTSNKTKKFKSNIHKTVRSEKSHSRLQPKRHSNPLFANIGSLSSGFKMGHAKETDGLGRFFILGMEDANLLSKIIEAEALGYQVKMLLKKGKDVLHFQGSKGPVWIICCRPKKGPFSHAGRLEDSIYSALRDQVGGVLASIKSSGIERLQIELHSTSDIHEKAFFVAVDIFGYSFRSVADEKGVEDFPQTHLHKVGGMIEKSAIHQYQAIAAAINLARHMVNTPPNFFNPKTAVDLVKGQFAKQKNITVEIWDEKRLLKEGMGLHLAVGQGAQFPPAMIHLQYRPKNSGKFKPIAFVGKGVTFDTGGYDIKPSSGMRYMKKDMGGSAAILGLAKWAVATNYDRPLDFYLSMAENMVDAKSFRPSDVVTARNGMKVEIHNTDAEGRLVMADSLDVAVSRRGGDEPEAVIDVATLTGAIKVALGGDIAGLFSNDDSLAEALNRAGQAAGDLNWRMPLFSRYTLGMSTPFADIVNAVDGFGGAITAALFLEKFVKQKSWAHLDIYAWNDKATGPWTSSGGNGQAVQCLIHFLEGKLDQKSK